MAKTTFPWIKTIARELGELDTIPLFGNSPPWNWSQMSALLSSSLQTQITYSSLNQGWKEPQEIKKSLGANYSIVSLQIIPLHASVFWAMPRADIDKFTSRMLYEKGKGKTSEIIREGFYRYLLLETLPSMQKIAPLEKLTLQLEEDAHLPNEPCFCIDVEIQLEDKTCWGSLIIPSFFRKKWVEHFSHIPSEYIPTEMASQTELVLGLKIAEYSLSQEEWDEIELGDFLPCDKKAYDARKKEGIATMTLGTIPLFQVRIQQNKLEFIDYAFIHEESMEEKKENHANVTVELAKIRMTLNELMHLSPGNMLELPIHPDQGVSLTINGKKVASGELVHLGEMLGVRVLTIGT